MTLPFFNAAMAAQIATAAALPSAITLSATLETSGVTSSITSAAVTVTVPVGNSGTIRFENIAALGSGGTLRYRKNSDPFVFVTDGDTETFTAADTDTLTLVATGCVAVGDGVTVDLIDQSTGTLIERVPIYRV